MILLVVLTNWTAKAQDYEQLGLDINGEAADDFSGRSVSISSDGWIVAIAAVGNDGAGASAGHVRVYAWNGTAWTQRGEDIDGEAAGDGSGESVSLSADGSIVAIGAATNSGAGAEAGHVRVYAWDGSAWTQRGEDIDGEAEGDWFGRSVSLSSDGSIVAIGASFNDGEFAETGHVRVFEWDGAAWTQRGGDIDGKAENDQSGSPVSLSADGSVVAIAVANAGLDMAGQVRVYSWDGTVWTQRGLDIEGEAASDQSGWSISLSGDGTIVAIGAIFNDGAGDSAGHVRVYHWDGVSWVQRGADLDGDAAEDFFGYSISLSSDGLVLAIGAAGNDGNGSSAGLVRIYEWSGGAWVQRGNEIAGDVASEFTGYSISLSYDGRFLASGTPFGSGNGLSSGRVRIYEFQSNRSPEASPDQIATLEDTPVSIDVLANDSDPDGDDLTVSIATNPSNGSVQLGTGGTIMYTPDGDFYGEDSFTYLAVDPGAAESSATVTVTVTAVQDAPVAQDDEATTIENTPVTFSLFANDLDVDGDEILLSSQDDPQHGVSVYNDDGTVTYTPEPDFVGSDSWSYSITDGPAASGAIATGTITVVVTPNPTSRETDHELPTEIYLNQNYPNPFNPTTTVEFGLPESGMARLVVYDVQGRLVEVLVSETLPAGRHTRQIHLDDVPSGVYLYRLEVGGHSYSRTLLLVK